MRTELLIDTIKRTAPQPIVEQVEMILKKEMEMRSIKHEINEREEHLFQMARSFQAKGVVVGNAFTTK